MQLAEKVENRNAFSQGQEDCATNAHPRILYFSSATHIQGGAAQSMFRLARWLKQQDGVPVVVLPREGSIIDWYAKEGINVQVIPFVGMHRKQSPLYLIRYLLSTVDIIIKLVTLIRQRCVNIVHVNEIIYFPGLIAGRIAGVKTICYVRVILERPVWVRRALSWIAEHFSDQILCVSDAVRVRMFSPQVSNIRVLYNPGPDLDRFDPQIAGDGISIRQQLGIASDTFVVGLVSKFVSNKGQLALVEAAHAIRTRNPGMNVRCLMVGGEVAGHEDYFAEVHDRIDQCGLKDAFILTGIRSDVPRMMAACDVVVHLPQHEDPFPGVVLEAMAMEKPIVAFASGGIPEQFEKGKSGILLQKNDIEALVKTLLALAEDKALRLQIGKEARRFLASRFSSEKFFSELGRIYSDLVSLESLSTRHNDG